MRAFRRTLVVGSRTWSSTTTMCCRRYPSDTTRGQPDWRRKRRVNWRPCTLSCWPAGRQWMLPRSSLRWPRRSTAVKTKGFSWRYGHMLFKHSLNMEKHGYWYISICSFAGRLSCPPLKGNCVLWHMEWNCKWLQFHAKTTKPVLIYLIQMFLPVRGKHYGYILRLSKTSLSLTPELKSLLKRKWISRWLHVPSLTLL